MHPAADAAALVVVIAAARLADAVVLLLAVHRVGAGVLAVAAAHRVGVVARVAVRVAARAAAPRSLSSLTATRVSLSHAARRMRL